MTGRRLETLSMIMYLSAIIKLALGLILHGWTTYVAFDVSGLAVAIATLMLPGLAEAYWIVDGLASGEIFWLPLFVSCVVYVGILTFLTPLLTRKMI